MPDLHSSVKDIPAEDAGRVLQGLVRFARLSGVHPKYNGVGVLKLGRLYTPYDFRPMMAEPLIQVMANVAIFGAIIAGLLLLWWSFILNRQKGRLCEDDSDTAHSAAAGFGKHHSRAR